VEAAEGNKGVVEGNNKGVDAPIAAVFPTHVEVATVATVATVVTVVTMATVDWATRDKATCGEVASGKKTAQGAGTKETRGDTTKGCDIIA